MKKIRSTYNVTEDGYQKVTDEKQVEYLNEILKKQGCECKVEGFYLRKEILPTKWASIQLRFQVEGTYYKMPDKDKTKNPNTGKRQAFRNAVKPQIDMYRELHFEMEDAEECEISGQGLTVDNVHVDHIEKPFAKLVKDFLEEKGITFDDITIENREIADEYLRGEWETYHYDNAVVAVKSVHKHMRETFEWYEYIPISAETPRMMTGVKKVCPCKKRPREVTSEIVEGPKKLTTNPWVEHVKQWQKDNNIKGYWQATKDPACKKAYEANKKLHV